MRQANNLKIALLGSGIIAITYGLARFVFGLFLPSIRDDLGLGATIAGVIGALPFISFVAGILAGPVVNQGLGPRRAGALAAGLAALGLLTIATAHGAVALGLGAAICGISTGLSSPVMAEAVHRAVHPNLRARVNAVHNAGTSLGVALAMPAMTWFLGAWRSAYLAFAVLAVTAAVAALAYLPGRSAARPAAETSNVLPPLDRVRWRAIAWLSVLASGMGVVSSIYWIFAPDLVVRQGGLSTGQSAWMWLVVGVVGLLGGASGDLNDRLGVRRTHALAVGLMTCALGLVAAAPAVLGLALISAAAFGAAYMTLTGLYLVQGVRLLADRPALGPVMPLLATTIGQAAGSVLSGWLIDAAGYGWAFALFASCGLALAAASRGLANG